MIKPSRYDYLCNPRRFFDDLDQWFRYCQRPPGYIIHSRIYLIHRSIWGKVRVPITKYCYTDQHRRRRIGYILEQLQEIKNTTTLKQTIARALPQNSYNAICQLIGYAYQRSSVVNFAKQIIGQTLEYNRQHTLQLQPRGIRFYIEVDDTYLKIRQPDRKAYKYRCRTIIIHQGLQNQSIINKVILVELTPLKQRGRSPTLLATLIQNQIKQTFAIDYPEFYLVSDGARWMKKLAHELQVQHHFLDRWHLLRRLNLALPATIKKWTLAFQASCLPNSLRWSLSSFLAEKLNQGKIKLVLQILRRFQVYSQIHLTLRQNCQLTHLCNYLRANAKLLNNYNHSGWIGSHTESFISHHIKKYNHQKFAVFTFPRVQFNICKTLTSYQKLIILDTLYNPALECNKSSKVQK